MKNDPDQELLDFLGMRSKRSKGQLMHILWGRFALAKPTRQHAARGKKRKQTEKKKEKKQQKKQKSKQLNKEKPAAAAAGSNSGGADEGSDSDGDACDVRALMGGGDSDSGSDDSSSEEEEKPKEEEILDLNDPDVIRMLQGGLRVRKRVSYRTDD